MIGGWKTNAPLGYKRFRTAAGAIRFAIEQLPKKLLLGASLEVGDERYNEAEIRQLYDSAASLTLQKAQATIEHSMQPMSRSPSVSASALSRVLCSNAEKKRNRPGHVHC